MTPFSAARLVMERSPHSILAGEGATKFAVENGMEAKETLTEDSRRQFEEWKSSQSGDTASSTGEQGESHDTVGMICLDCCGNLAAGT